MSLLRVEVYRAGQMLEGRTFPNQPAARSYADHQLALGNLVIVMFPRAEPWHDFGDPLTGQERLVDLAADDQS